MQELDPRSSGYLAALTERTQSTLVADLVGVYAAGSLALGAYEHGRSDIDIAIVCAGCLHCRQAGHRRCAAARIVALSGPWPGAGRLPAGDCGRRSLRSGIRSRVEHRPADAVPCHLVRCRPAAGGRNLLVCDRPQHPRRKGFGVGRSAGGDRVPLGARGRSGHVVDWVVALAPGPSEPTGAEADASWTDDAVLNACRAWRRVRSGHWSSKQAAGREVLSDERRPGSGPRHR